MCPYCPGFECVNCKFCTKFYHDGQRIIKRQKTLSVNDERRYDMTRDESDPRVPSSYYPMSTKAADEACGYDYDFEDMRTMDELKEDLDTIIARMHTGGRKLF